MFTKHSFSLRFDFVAVVVVVVVDAVVVQHKRACFRRLYLVAKTKRKSELCEMAADRASFASARSAHSDAEASAVLGNYRSHTVANNAQRRTNSLSRIADSRRADLLATCLPATSSPPALPATNSARLTCTWCNESPAARFTRLI